jgi:hypothetical protein
MMSYEKITEGDAPRIGELMRQIEDVLCGSPTVAPDRAIVTLCALVGVIAQFVQDQPDPARALEVFTVMVASTLRQMQEAKKESMLIRLAPNE